ncbi:MAG: hypothetical protein WCL28_14235, partial [bacterium]
MNDATRNLTWSRDELMVELDAYLRYQSFIPGMTMKEIADLGGPPGGLVKATPQPIATAASNRVEYLYHYQKHDAERLAEQLRCNSIYLSDTKNFNDPW